MTKVEIEVWWDTAEDNGQVFTLEGDDVDKFSDTNGVRENERVYAILDSDGEPIDSITLNMARVRAVRVRAVALAEA